MTTVLNAQPSVAETDPTRPGSPRDSHHKRLDLQGLRAVAVVGVVLDHLVGWPSGGFVGVDVFFVLSGFLITGLLLRERDRTGRTSITDFYRRRVKRILPAAVTVLATTLVASWALFPTTRFHDTVADTKWALLFAANWRFGLQGTDYFDANRPVSPVQHFWSLAVEEQFYLLWPALMIATFALFRHKSAKTRRLALGGLGIAIAAISFTWALQQTRADAGLAYFSSLTRGWELALGAMLAVAAPVLSRIPGRIARPMGWLGLLGVLASYVIVNENVGFPAPWAALPVVATAVAVAAGTSAGEAGPRPLRSRPVTYVGDISYSLYLWHFPVIIIGGLALGDSVAALLALGAITVVLAVYSYELIEQPLRRRRWSPSGFAGPRSLRGRNVAFTVPVVLLVALLAPLAIGSLRTSPDPTRLVAGQATAMVVNPLTPLERQWRKYVVAALSEKEWPKLEPNMDRAISSPQAPPDVVGCGTLATRQDPGQCTWGSADAPKSAFVVGDSVSMTYVNPIRIALARRAPGQWRTTSVGTFGCPFVNLELGDSRTVARQCASRREEAAAAIKAAHPDVVFIANSADTPKLVGSGSSVSEPQWRTGLRQELRQTLGPGTRLVILSPPPGDKDIGECYTRLSKPTDCVGQVSDAWKARSRTERALAKEFGGTWISSAPWFCFNGYCPAFVDGTPVRSDAVHMTIEYARRTVPLLLSALRSQSSLAETSGRP